MLTWLTFFFRKLGAASVVEAAPYAEPAFTITRLHPRTQSIGRQKAGTQTIGRLYAKTTEVTSE